jgi:acetyltransferase-like isoleucine patch superfamily enzyme
LQFTDEGVGNNSNHDACANPPASIEIYGNNNRIYMSPTAVLPSFKVLIKGNSNSISISDACELRGLVFVKGDKSALIVGRGSTAAGVRFTVGDGATISIGTDCMLSRNVEIRCWDEHPIYDLATKERLNRGKDVILGDHVWLSEGVNVNKGISIAAGCVIGVGAVVSRSLTEPNAAYAGIPARKLRSGIAWARSPKTMDWDQFDFTR